MLIEMGHGDRDSLVDNSHIRLARRGLHFDRNQLLRDRG